MTKEDILAWVAKELDIMKTTVCPCRKLLGFKHGWCDVMTKEDILAWVEKKYSELQEKNLNIIPKQ